MRLGKSNVKKERKGGIEFLTRNTESVPHGVVFFLNTYKEVTNKYKYTRVKCGEKRGVKNLSVKQMKSVL